MHQYALQIFITPELPHKLRCDHFTVAFLIAIYAENGGHVPIFRVLFASLKCFCF